MRHRPAPALAALLLLAAPACSEDAGPPPSDAPWSAEVVHDEGFCNQPSRCVRTLRVDSTGTLTVTDDIGPLDLAPAADDALFAAWADAARTLAPTDCPTVASADIFDTLHITATYDGSRRELDEAQARGCLRHFVEDSELGALIERTFDLVEEVYACEEWVATSVGFEPLEVDEGTERYACR